MNNTSTTTALPQNPALEEKIDVTTDDLVIATIGTTLGSPPEIEWLTLFLALAIYSSWMLLTAFHSYISIWLLFILGGLVIAWHSSFQHEVVHGHPTRSKLVNYALGFPPLALWLPFTIYRDSHRLHHRDAKLTDPLHDPESKYWSETAWHRLPRPLQLIEIAQSSLLGRITIGPFCQIGKFLVHEGKRTLGGDRVRLRLWLKHAASLIPVFVWLIGYCHMSIGEYLALFVYPGTSLLLLRSFAEHKASQVVGHRTAVIECAPPFGLLFLNNNLHAVHHHFPSIPWYRLPSLYRQHREAILAANGGLVYKGYRDIIARYMWKPNDIILHPSVKD